MPPRSGNSEEPGSSPGSAGALLWKGPWQQWLHPGKEEPLFWNCAAAAGRNRKAADSAGRILLPNGTPCRFITKFGISSKGARPCSAQKGKPAINRDMPPRFQGNHRIPVFLFPMI